MLACCQIPGKAKEMLDGGLREILESPSTIKIVAEGRQVSNVAPLFLVILILASHFCKGLTRQNAFKTGFTRLDDR